MNDEKYWDMIFDEMKSGVVALGAGLPSVSLIAEEGKDPFRVLISTLISLRAKDEVTLAASRRLFTLADTAKDMIAMSDEQIEKAIYPAGFYKRKAKNILVVSKILCEEYDGVVPDSQDALLALPGVGIKTANLTLNLGFGIDAICVDTHVHRISNRMGWIETKTPEQSEVELQTVLPQRFWISLNELLVTYGQKICTPLSPHCSTCTVQNICKQVAVGKHR